MDGGILCERKSKKSSPAVSQLEILGVKDIKTMQLSKIIQTLRDKGFNVENIESEKKFGDTVTTASGANITFEKVFQKMTPDVPSCIELAELSFVTDIAENASGKHIAFAIPPGWKESKMPGVVSLAVLFGSAA